MAQAAARGAARGCPGLPSRPRKSCRRRVRASEMFAGLLSRIDAIGESGLDGHDLRELGLKNGNLTVNDERTGKRWTFRDISLSVERARRRRRRGHRRLGQCRAAVGADGVDRADRQRLPQDRSRGAPRRGERSPFGLAPRRRKRADRHAALGEHCRPGRARRRAETRSSAASSPRPARSASANDEDGRLRVRPRRVQAQLECREPRPDRCHSRSCRAATGSP